jgi:hypothetical protein
LFTTRRRPKAAKELFPSLMIRRESSFDDGSSEKQRKLTEPIRGKHAEPSTRAPAATASDERPTNLLQELLTESVEIEEEKEEEEGAVNKEIAPHEYLYPTAPPTTTPPTTTPPTTTATTKKKEETIQRYKFSGPPPSEGVSASAAVATNGLVFIGALTCPGIIGFNEKN